MTTNTTTIYKNKLKRTIKTGMHALQLDDATYRDMLANVSQRVSGSAKRSIKNMTLAELNGVIDEMRSKGFEARRGKYSGKKDNSVRNKDEQRIERPMLGKVQALWITMHQQGFVKDGSDNALNAFARKLFNKQRKQDDKPLIINLRGADDRELWQLIETLKSWQQREEDKLRLQKLKNDK
ncbi:regulatory protein GemA [Psychrobacter sp. FDAARGOS_221]|uniref:regulatory protein GemA n=1 Tax=Psychrobacter sp. FDAARGOS_221 TaxID=1975705 RepID=UPI000BB546BE|nr:regulatory protein GemA [Psychrobacter sp. FDAARGOS_221]PNK59941.1 regulatory protein GemA [Psychrobacter sp. FDAARGOS_221]